MKNFKHVDYSYYKEIFRSNTLPLAFVDMDMLDANIDAIAARAGNKKVRIASKSIRAVAIIQYILKKRPDVYNGVMAYYPEEAIHLYHSGIRDILLAYPYSHPDQLKNVAAAVKEGAAIRLMIDHLQQAEKASAAAREAGRDLEVCLDVDMSTQHLLLYFGVFRSPLRVPGEVVELSNQISRLPGLTITGMMGYEAQVAGVGDRIPGKTLQNLLVGRLRKRSHHAVARRREEVFSALIDSGFDISLVNGGGTGSLEFTRTESCVTEITVGSGFFNSGLFDWYSNFSHLPAAAYAIEITRVPARGMYTAAGGGYIASGGVGMEKQPVPYLPLGIRLVSNEGLGEVQTPFYYSGKDHLQIGDPVFFRHTKAGELCERFNRLHLVRQGKIVEAVPTCRGEGFCFL
jgi:D-serine deaminase-like pyridoxal phosphate-dependent protein